MIQRNPSTLVLTIEVEQPKNNNPQIKLILCKHHPKKTCTPESPTAGVSTSKNKIYFYSEVTSQSLLELRKQILALVDAQKIDNIVKGTPFYPIEVHIQSNGENWYLLLLWSILCLLRQTLFQSTPTAKELWRRRRRFWQFAENEDS